MRAFGSGSSWFVASLAESKLTELYLAFSSDECQRAVRRVGAAQSRLTIPMVEHSCCFEVGDFFGGVSKAKEHFAVVLTETGSL